MPTRFDHAVIGVRNLDVAVAQFRHLGFDAQPGGRHEHGGTHNALIRFGLDYLELLAVYDPEAARRGGETILDTLNGREAALLTYALATETIEEEAERFVGYGTKAAQPYAMGRKRPDGQSLTWRVASPGKLFSHSPWPFLIQWDTPDKERLGIDVPGIHANGVLGWSKIAVAVNDLEQVVTVYRDQLGLELVSQTTSSTLMASGVTFGSGQSLIEVLAPDGDGLVKQVLVEEQEGPFALYLKVRNLETTRAYLEKQKITFTYAAEGAGLLMLDAAETSGLRLYFVG